MNKQEWLQFVKQIIEQNPNWMSDTVMAMQAGIEGRLKQEMEYSTDIEIALVTSLDKKTDKDLLLKGIKALRRYGKTKWQEEWIKKLSKTS